MTNPPAAPKLLRADPLLLREEFREHLTSQEQRELGIDLATGADHPRAWVGPPFVYDLLGAVQFQLLLDLGMREYHRFLDVGCGSLRLGRLALTYLMEGRYFGVEPNRKILNEGCRMHFGAGLRWSQVIRRKKPRFVHNTDFDFSFTKGPVDFVFAQSIASHTGLDLTKKLLESIAEVSHDETISMVTYIRCGIPEKSNKLDGWFYPECVLYTDADFGAMAKAAGLHAYRTHWPATNIHADGLITSQQPTILCKTPWQPKPAQAALAESLGGIIKIN